MIIWERKKINQVYILTLYIMFFLCFSAKHELCCHYPDSVCESTKCLFFFYSDKTVSAAQTKHVLELLKDTLS